MPPQQYSGLPAPSMQTISGATAGTSGTNTPPTPLPISYNAGPGPEITHLNSNLSDYLLSAIPSAGGLCLGGHWRNALPMPLSIISAFTEGEDVEEVHDPSNRHMPYKALQFIGMESYLTSSQAQAYQEAAAMQAVAAQEAFVASINEAQASQTVQLMQQAALAGISLSPAQAAEMAQQATMYAQQAFAQQQTAMYLQVNK